MNDQTQHPTNLVQQPWLEFWGLEQGQQQEEERVRVHVTFAHLVKVD